MIDGHRLKRAADLLHEQFGLAALYLFGSHANGHATVSSDVDLAALFRTSVDPIDLLRLQGELAMVLRCDVDLVDLSIASPIVAMQVLRHGCLVHEGDRRVRVAFEAVLPSRYEDIVRIRQPQIDALIARMNHG